MVADEPTQPVGNAGDDATRGGGRATASASEAMMAGMETPGWVTPTPCWIAQMRAARAVRGAELWRVRKEGVRGIPEGLLVHYLWAWVASRRASRRCWRWPWWACNPGARQSTWLGKKWAGRSSSPHYTGEE